LAEFSLALIRLIDIQLEKVKVKRLIIM
jgi:hypothetical protein